MKNWMDTFTRSTYNFILLFVSVFPLIVWSLNPSEVNLGEVGGFIAGLGVPMSALTAAMAMKGISRDRQQQDTQK